MFHQRCSALFITVCTKIIAQEFDEIPVMDSLGSKQVRITKVSPAGVSDAPDLLAVEEPLEIRVGFWRDGRREHKNVSITMRTPGDDLNLAAGFLFTEGIVTDREQIAGIRHCGKPIREERENNKEGEGEIGHAQNRDAIENPTLKIENTNTVRVDFRPDVTVDLARLERHFYTSSSCGVCGKTSLEALEAGRCLAPMRDDLQIQRDVVHQLPARLRETQAVFDATGGLHAAALFDAAGTLRDVREDVGRHNALDKLIGAAFSDGRTPLSDSLLFVSGRASFELVQKALMAGIPVLAAVGAPSSLAVALADRYGMTLIGFVREQRFNIYCGGQRLALP